MFNIFYNECLGFYRNRISVFFILFFIILLFIVTFFGIIQNKKQIQSQNDAHSHIRAQWDEMTLQILIMQLILALTLLNQLQYLIV